MRKKKINQEQKQKTTLKAELLLINMQSRDYILSYSSPTIYIF